MSRPLPPHVKRSVYLIVLAGSIAWGYYFFDCVTADYDNYAMFSGEMAHYTIANHHGDELTVRTSVGDGRRDVNVISLRHPHQWFSTPLFTVVSGSIWVDLLWRDDDHAEVALDFDKDAKASTPVTAVGPFHIKYILGVVRHGDPQQGYSLQ